MLLFCFLATVGRRLIRNSGVFHSAVLKVCPGTRYEMLRHRAVGDSEAPEQDSNIVYGFHLISIYNRAQFLDKTDPCRSMSRRQGRVRTGAAIECHMECHQDITPETPSLAPAGAAHACLCLPWVCSAWVCSAWVMQ